MDLSRSDDATTCEGSDYGHEDGDQLEGNAAPADLGASCEYGASDDDDARKNETTPPSNSNSTHSYSISDYESGNNDAVFFDMLSNVQYLLSKRKYARVRSYVHHCFRHSQFFCI